MPDFTEHTIARTLWGQDGSLFLISIYCDLHGELTYYAVELHTAKVADIYFEYDALKNFLHQQSMEFIGYIDELDIDSYLAEKQS